MRQVVLDTETTGKRPAEGHRIVEIAGIELINRQKTGRVIHFYINPERDIPDEVVKIHGITNDFVKDKPNFAKVAREIAEFFKDAELIAHNAKFDTDFINAEFQAAGIGKLWDYTSKVTDSLFLSRSIDADEARHNLDALCKRYNISTEGREFHGALLDSELLTEAYLKMTEGRSDLDIKERVEQTNWQRPEIVRFAAPHLKVVETNEQDLLAEWKMKSLVASKSKNKAGQEEANKEIIQLEKKLGIYKEVKETTPTASVAPVASIAVAKPAQPAQNVAPVPTPTQKVEPQQTSVSMPSTSTTPAPRASLRNSFGFLKK